MYFFFLCDPDQLEATDLENRIIGLDFCPGTDLLEFFVTAKIAGLVCPGIRQADLVQLLRNELGVINTGNEPLPYCILIMEGFGRERLSAPIRQLLERQSGLLVHLEPHTRIRAGVARPFLCFMD
jgi:hypothetical protein